MKKKAFQAASVYFADLRRISFFRNVLWFINEKQGFFLFLSDGDEYGYFCGVYGICDGKSPCIRVSSAPCFFSDADGECQTPFLWHIHVGKIQKHGMEKAIFDLWDV